MKTRELLRVSLAWGICAFVFHTTAESLPVRGRPEPKVQAFTVKGVVQDLGTNANSLLIAHEAIAGYMDAMTMPFRVKDQKELVGLQAGDQISFRLCVTDTESWVEHIAKTAQSIRGGEPCKSAVTEATVSKPPHARHPLLNFAFTNELGQPVRLSDFRGQALAITFFFTRCPIPDFCPRLSKNFEEASRKLSAMPDAPTNWHFLSVSFDSHFDTPEVLQAYGQLYHYDPKHWSFLTGPAAEIGELARLSDATFKPESGFFEHNFRTLIIDAAGNLQMTFPIGGNLSEMIVSEILRAASAKSNQARLRASPSPFWPLHSPFPPSPSGRVQG